MYILGLNFSHNGSAALIKNKKLVGFIATERLTRNKCDRGVNKKVIKYLLDKEGIKFKDVNLIAVVNWFFDRDNENNELFDKSADGFAITTDNGIEYSIEDYVQFHQDQNQLAQGFFTFHIGDLSKPCMLVDHHFAHCAYAWYMSPFDDAMCFSLDVNDNMGTNHAVYYFNEKDKFYRAIRRGGDFNVGGFYSSVCDYLGFYPSLTDAGKVMALAAYGAPKKYSDIVWPKVVQMGDLYHGDQFMHLMGKHKIKKIPNSRGYFPQLKGEGGKPDKYWLKKSDWEDDLHKNIAADTQYILEQSVKSMLHKLLREQKITQNICLAGGTFLNCAMNGNMEKEFSYHNFFAAPACGDDGLTIGAGLFVADNMKINKKKELHQSTAGKRHIHSTREIFEGGKIYSAGEIYDAIKNTKLQRASPDKERFNKRIVAKLKDDKVVGLFTGGSEIGPRALCHRSILASASNPEMKDILNKKVKHREEFRPFGPVVLEDEADMYFDLIRSEYPFMLFNLKCLIPDEIPSGIHVDNTARIQTANEKDNPVIFGILTELYKQTKKSVLINTSFNVQGEPIVETPEDALNCFKKTKIDVVAFTAGDKYYLVEK